MLAKGGGGGGGRRAVSQKWTMIQKSWVIDRIWVYNLLNTGRALYTLSCRETHGRARDLVQGLKKGFLAGQVTFKSYLSNEHGVQASCDLLVKSLFKKSKKWAQESKMWELKFNFDLSPASFRMCGSRKYPDPHHGGNWKFQGGGGVRGPGNSRRNRGWTIKSLFRGAISFCFWPGIEHCFLPTW